MNKKLKLSCLFCIIIIIAAILNITKLTYGSELPVKKVLIFGITGTVGSALAEELRKNKDYEIYGTYYEDNPDITDKRYYQFDMGDLKKLETMLNSVKPDIVVSALRGDFSKQLAFHKELAQYLKKNNGSLYFCSTANVFDKDLTKPHYEDDPCESFTDYGKFKIECEKSLKEILGDNFIILRLSQVWGKKSPRMKELLELLNKNGEIEASSHIYATRITDKMAAKQIHYIMENNLKGTFHLGTSDIMSEKDFITELIEKLGYKNAKIKEASFNEDKYLAVLSRKNIWPEDLIFTQSDIIKELFQK